MMSSSSGTSSMMRRGVRAEGVTERVPPGRQIGFALSQKFAGPGSENACASVAYRDVALY